MPVSIGASGLLGVAIEGTSGTYKAPTKFIPFNSESLKYNINAVEQRSIRETAGLVGIIPGNATVEGDVEFDTFADGLVYFLMATRCTYIKSATGAGSGPYKYVFTPTSRAVPDVTLSITIKRGDEVFGYTGCVVGSFTIAVGDDGKMTTTMTVLGRDEKPQAAPVATWPTSPVFQAGMYNLQIPTATQIYDADTFEFSSEDNGQSNARLKNTQGSAFVNFGESNATIKFSRDFINRADYDTYKNGTAQSITCIASADAENSITVSAPVAIKTSYEVNIGGQGDLIRASIEYGCVIDSTGKHYQITVLTTEDL